MAVDEARHEHHAGAVDDLFRLLLRGAQADVADFPVGDAHKGVGIDVHLRVHGDAGDVGKQNVHYRNSLRSSEDSGTSSGAMGAMEGMARRISSMIGLWGTSWGRVSSMGLRM